MSTNYTLEATSLPLSSRTSETIEDIISIDLNLRHTASHTARLTVSMSTNNIEELRFGDTITSYGTDVLLKGEVLRVQKNNPNAGQATIEITGPTLELKRDGPDTPITYTNERVSDAIRDYYSTRGINGTVFEPPTEIVDNDTKIRDSDNVNFDGFYDAGTNEPIESNTTHLKALQTCKTQVQNTWTNNGGTFQSDSTGQTNYHISGEYIVLDSDLDNVEMDFSWEYPLPAERVGVAVSAVLVGSGAGTIPLTFNGTQVTNVVTTGDQPGGDWFVFDTEYGANGGSDLVAGNNYALDITLNSTDFDVELDAVAIYDTAYPPTNWDEPDSLGDTIEGPEWYPIHTLDLIPQQLTWNIIEGRVDATVNDTSNQFRWRLSPNGNGYLAFSNQADATADFDGNSLFGTEFNVELRFGGYNDGNVTGSQDGKPINRNSGQELTSLEWYATTDTTPVVANLELSSSDFENLKRLHNAGGMRFVADPETKPVTLESFGPTDSSVQKTATWEETATPQPEWQVYEYANWVRVIGPSGSAFTVKDDDEIARLGGRTIKAAPIYAPEADTVDERRVRAKEELLKRVSEDDTTGQIEATPTLVLPGYPYPTPWGTAPLERVTYREATGNVGMTLDFSELEIPTKRLIEDREEIRDLQKNT